MRFLINRILNPILGFFGLSKMVFINLERTKLRLQNLKASLSIKKVKLSPKAKSAGFSLYCCIQNDAFRIKPFINYYESLGVNHFHFIDFDSEDGIKEILDERENCSHWNVSKQPFDAGNMLRFTNYLISKFTKPKKWSMAVEVDEYLVFPHMESRNITELIGFLNDIEIDTLFCTVIDRYHNPENHVDLHNDEIDLNSSFPYFDRYNFIQKLDRGSNTNWVQGGARMRIEYKDMPQNAPYINKLPLVRRKSHVRYVSYTNSTNVPEINCTIKDDQRYISAVLMKFITYNEKTPYIDYYDPFWAIEYEDSEQIETLKIMQRGEWF